jgi:hypothetical protein
MTTDIIVYDRMEDPGEFVKQMGLAILHSEMFGCTNASQGAVLALECMARRVPPMTLAERYHIIHGRLSMRADAMLSDFRTKCGGSHRIVERTADAAEIELTAAGQSHRFRLTWEDAKGEPFVYVGKESIVLEKIQQGRWKDLMVKAKYATPRARSQMLWARVVSDGVRAMAPEVVAGYYCPEEIDDLPEPAARAPQHAPIVGEIVQSGTPTPTPTPTEQPRKGISLSAETQPQSLDSSEVQLDGPCSADHVDMIRHLGQQLKIPVEAIKGMIERRGKSRLVELTILEAENIIRKLERKLREEEIPF